MFRTQTEARRFFAKKVIQRAETEQVPLSEDERQMLLWSESAPDSVADPGLAERLAAVISDADYEAKIIGLLHPFVRLEAHGTQQFLGLVKDPQSLVR